MTVEEFTAAVDPPAHLRAAAFQVFVEESQLPRKTLAHRLADLADGLRQLGVDEPGVHAAALLLAQERR